jgi:hypothetical protein
LNRMLRGGAVFSASTAAERLATVSGTWSATYLAT